MQVIFWVLVVYFIFSWAFIFYILGYLRSKREKDEVIKNFLVELNLRQQQVLAQYYTPQLQHTQTHTADKNEEVEVEDGEEEMAGEIKKETEEKMGEQNYEGKKLSEILFGGKRRK